MVPILRVSGWEELNTRLEGESRKRRLRRLRGHTETIGERFERDHAAMLLPPAAPCEACEWIAGPSVHCHWFGTDPTTTPCPRSRASQVWVKG